MSDTTENTMVVARFTSDAQLENWFGYHPPANSDVARGHEMIREAHLNVAHLLQRVLPEGPDKTATFRALREAMWNANATLACNATAEYRLNG